MQTSDLDGRLEEYKVINEMLRHDGTLAWISIGLFLPASLAVFALAANVHFDSSSADPSRADLIAAGVASAVIWAIGWFSAERFQFFALTRLKRARELEQDLGMSHHRKIYAEDKYPRKLVNVMWPLRIVVGPSLIVLWSAAIISWT